MVKQAGSFGTRGPGALRSAALGPDVGRRRGSITVAALVAVLMTFALCMCFLQLSHGATRRQGQAVDLKNAFYLAEAGLAEAYCGLTVAKTGNVGTSERPAAFGDGVFWVEATELGDDIVQLESTALYGRGRVSLGLAAQRVSFHAGDLGFFVSDAVSVNPDILIDSFDSSQGTYAEQALAGLNNDQAVLGSNGDIALSNGDVVKGDLLVGAGRTGDVPAGATLTGSVRMQPASTVLPPVVVPDVTLSPAVSVSDPAAPFVLPPGEHGLESLTLQAQTTGTLVGPATIVVKELRAMRDSLLTFDTRNGPIDLYVLDKFDLDTSSSAVTVNSRPDEITVQIAGTGDAILGAKSHFYGQIYAPGSQLKVSAHFEVYGALVAQSLNLAAKGRMHMDINTRPTRGEVLPTMFTWRVVDIPDAVAASGFGLLQTLGVERSSLSSPAESHQDQWLSVTYVDLDGATRTYEGMESEFDWTQVSQVLSGSRDGRIFRAVPEPRQDSSAGAGDGGSGEPADLTPEEQALIDLIDAPTPSRDLKQELLNQSPVTDPVLLAAITREPPMDHPDLKQVLLQNGPLSESVLIAAIDEADFLGASLVEVLTDNSPLSTGEMQAMLTREPPLSATEVNVVLAVQ